MEKDQDLTFVDQAIVDTTLTNINLRSRNFNTPFEYALESSIQNFIKEGINSGENTESIMTDINEDLENALKIQDIQSQN